MPTHIPAQEFTYTRREFWWCEGLLHRHFSLAKAEECERNPTAHDPHGRTRVKRE